MVSPRRGSVRDSRASAASAASGARSSVQSSALGSRARDSGRTDDDEEPSAKDVAFFNRQQSTKSLESGASSFSKKSSNKSSGSGKRRSSSGGSESDEEKGKTSPRKGDGAEGKEEPDLEKGRGSVSDSPRDPHAHEVMDMGEDDDYDYSDYDIDEEEEEEEEESDYDDDDDYEASSFGSKSEGEEVEVLSNVSNEKEPSEEDYEIPDAERQMALVMTEPTWTGACAPCMRFLVSCLLPLLFTCFVIYALAKLLRVIIQVLLDIWNLIKRLIWFFVRLALSPLYILYKMVVPGFIQDAIWSTYYKNFGVYVDAALECKASLEHNLLDLPNVILACGLAATDTCIRPAKAQGNKYWWKYVGVHLEDWVLIPARDSHFNRLMARKRKQAHDLSRDPNKKEKLKRMAPKIARQKLRAQRERAKRIREKKKMAQLEITLAIGQDEKGLHMGEKVRLQDKERNQIISRTMIVERRYAVAVGFVWFMIGMVIGVLTINGARDERCVICEDYDQVGMQVCRHAYGRSCAFQLYQPQILVAGLIMAVGMVLLVYSIFLYKPKQLHDKLSEAQKKRKEDLINAALGSMKKQEDPQVEVINFLKEQKSMFTVARTVKHLYKESVVGGWVENFGVCMNRPLGAIFKWEEKHKLKERSIVLQEWSYFFMVGWITKCFRCVTRQKEGGPSLQTKMSRAYTRHVKKGFRNSCIDCVGYLGLWRCLERIIRCTAQSALGRCVQRCMDRSPLVARCCRCLHRLIIPSRAHIAIGGAAIGAGHRTGREGGGTDTLEAVLTKFGLKIEEVVEEDEKARVDAKNLGLEETQLLVGMFEEDMGPFQDEPDVGILRNDMEDEFDEDKEKYEDPPEDADDEEESDEEDYDSEDEDDSSES